MKKSKIAIVDYGVGNLRSLIRAFEHFGADVTITEEAREIYNADAIVLPGDGAFAAGMHGLKVRNLTQSVIDFAMANKSVLGICLGAQILLSEGFEFGHHQGLDLIAGRVIKFPKLSEKIPQIGWNSLMADEEKIWGNSILKDIRPGSNVYFIHSYIMVPKNKKEVVSNSEYGGFKFASVIAKGHIYGCQFHPEKSGQVGLAIIKNFLDQV